MTTIDIPVDLSLVPRNMLNEYKGRLARYAEFLAKEMLLVFKTTTEANKSVPVWQTKISDEISSLSLKNKGESYDMDDYSSIIDVKYSRNETLS